MRMEVVDRDRPQRDPDRLGTSRREPQRLRSAPTLDAIDARGLLLEIDTLHLDRGYDNNVVRTLCADVGLDDLIVRKKRRHGQGKVKLSVSLGMRWPVERTNSWLSNFGQMRRNTDRFIHQRLDQLALAISLVITIKLIKWADRWSPAT